MGKAQEFAKFYELHFEAVYRFVYFRVKGNRDVAEDLTSDIFISALNAFDRFDPSKGAKAWIMTIARNKVINHWRDRKETVDVDELAPFIKGEDGRQTAEQNERLSFLTQALNKLKPEERTIVEMKYLLGYSYDDIAHELDKTAGAARVESHRALKKLKTQLKNF